MKKFISEFKDFALKGNVMNLAVGIIIGAAFQGVVTSFVNNVLSPVIGLIGGTNFDGLTLKFLGVSLEYGAFITAVINFVIMAFVVFLIVKGMNKLTGAKPAEEPSLRTCPYCFTKVEKAATRCPACTSQLEPESEAAAGTGECE